MWLKLVGSGMADGPSANSERVQAGSRCVAPTSRAPLRMDRKKLRQLGFQRIAKCVALGAQIPGSTRSRPRPLQHAICQCLRQFVTTHAHSLIRPKDWHSTANARNPLTRWYHPTGARAASVAADACRYRNPRAGRKASTRHQPALGCCNVQLGSHSAYGHVAVESELQIGAIQDLHGNDSIANQVQGQQPGSGGEREASVTRWVRTCGRWSRVEMGAVRFATPTAGYDRKVRNLFTQVRAARLRHKGLKLARELGEKVPDLRLRRRHDSCLPKYHSTASRSLDNAGAFAPWPSARIVRLCRAA